VSPRAKPETETLPVEVDDASRMSVPAAPLAKVVFAVQVAPNSIVPVPSINAVPLPVTASSAMRPFRSSSPRKRATATQYYRSVVILWSSPTRRHRSQYDFIDGFARHMRDALPNASFIGFLADIKYGVGGPSLTFKKGVLTVSDGTDTAQIKMVGSFTQSSFHTAPDNSGGTLITDPPPQISQDSAKNEVLVSNDSFVFKFGNGPDNIGPRDQNLNDHIDVFPSALHDLSQLSAAFEVANHESTMIAGHDVSLHQSHVVLSSHDFILK
jgi:hypothetical protein